MDFTLATYTKLLRSLIENGYEFLPFAKFNPQSNKNKVVILRHDVDDKPVNSYKTSLIENDLGIQGTYYFRIVKQSFDKDIIRKISALGHEIGYHYEDLSLAKGDIGKAMKLFEKHLKQFEDCSPIETICMHGSPLSKHDNRLLWKSYKYSDFGVLKEPYFDIDFSKVLYLTDTGRKWDGEKVSVRDKELKSGSTPLSGSYKFRTTQDLISAVNAGKFPDQIMLNFHPQRWTNNPFLWSKELILQNIKNQLKRIIVLYQKKKFK